MKYTGLILFVMIALYSCRPHIQEMDTISERGPDSLYAAYLVMARSLPDSLGKIPAAIITKEDTGIINGKVLKTPYLCIGDLMCNGGSYALYSSNLDYTNGTMCLYHYQNETWQKRRCYFMPYFITTVQLDKAISGKEVFKVYGYMDSNTKVCQMFQYDSQNDLLVKTDSTSFSVH